MKMMWLWTPKLKKMVALNAYANDGSECLCKWWLWTPMETMALNAYGNGGSERMEMMAQNAYGNDGSERLWKMMALTYENDGSECLCKMVALNAYAKWWWLWTPMEMMAMNAYENGGFECRNWKEMVALNAKLKRTTLNVVTENKWWLWMLSYEEMIR